MTHFLSCSTIFEFQELSHLCRRPEFPVSPWVMRIVHALYFKSYQYRHFRLVFPATAGKRSVNRTIFIAMQFHGNAPGDSSRGGESEHQKLGLNF